MNRRDLRRKSAVTKEIKRLNLKLKIIDMKNAYLYTLLSNVICWWIGHDIGKYNDSGYEVCQRCNKHEYYDYKTWDRGIPFHKLYRWTRHKLLLIKSWYKIKFFNELPF